MDVLTDVLNTLQLAGSLYCRTDLSLPWGMRFAPPLPAMFHVVDQGMGWLKLDSEDTYRHLKAGEVVLLPHGDGHALSDHQDSPLVDILIEDSARHECQALRFGNSPSARVLCGMFHFENPRGHPLLTLLPKVIHLSVATSLELVATLRTIGVESSMQRPGSETILRRLADILFVQIIRGWIECQPAEWTAGGWLGALRDPQIGVALELMHRQPERAWTVAGLAKEVSMSRTAFAMRFAALVGEPPTHYLTRWRIHTAAMVLKHERTSVLDVARRVGYESEAAFCKAFKREVGTTPGRYRRSA
jgi:AraC-like DNA-binding protein